MAAASGKGRLCAVRFLRARFEPFAQFIQAGRQDEDADDVLLVLLIELLRALPVDVEQIVLPARKPLADDPLGRAIAISEHLGPFVELILFDHDVKTRV